MRRLTASVSTLALAAALALTPGSASAATGEYGNQCSAASVTDDLTLVLASGAAGNPIPSSAPRSGVVTKATFTLPADAPGAFPQKLKIVRPAAGPDAYTVVAESGDLLVGPGTHTYPVRLPVTAGDLLGLGGSVGALYCTTPNAGDTVAVINGDAVVGTTATALEMQNELSLPVVATVEPDADKDGYGDVSQDGCPQSASFQSACPVVRLDSIALGQGSSILVLVASSSQVKVSLTGTAKVGGKTVRLSAKAEQVTPGKFGSFKVKLPKALKAALAALPRSRSITVTLVSSAKNLTGKPTQDKTKVKLPGTG